MDDVLMKLEALVNKELNKIVVKGDITPTELDLATKAACLLEKLKMLEGFDSEESYSRRSYYDNRDYSNNMPSLRRTRSYGYYGDPYYDQGYSSHSVRDRMIATLESTMMDKATSESEKRTIEKMIQRLSMGE